LDDCEHTFQMKIYLVIRICLSFSIGLLSTAIQAQNLNLEWAKSMGGGNQDESFSITLDDSGNVYVTGNFKDTVDFDPGPSSFYLTSNGRFDIFIQKLDASGKFNWARSMGGTRDDFSTSITIDTVGDVYVTGSFKDTVDFGGAGSSFNMISNGDYDIFILKLDSRGNTKWVKSFGGKDYDVSTSITTKGADNVYICGAFYDTIYYNQGGGQLSLTSFGYMDALVVKIDGGGNFIWAKSFGGKRSEEGRSITTDGSGNVYVTGSFGKTADFDPDTSIFNLTSNGSADPYILKLDEGGNFIWAKSWGGTLNDQGVSIATDTLGNVYATGYYEDLVDFDPSLATFNLTSKGDYDIFLQKLDSSGNFMWAKSVGGSLQDVARSVITDTSGSVYVTGSYNDKVDFDPDTASTFNLTSKGGVDVFIQKLDNSGNFIWAKSMGGMYNDWSNSISADKSGNVFVTGGFNSTADFDPSAATFNLTSKGQWDAFVLKLSKCGFVTGIDVVTACDSYTWIDGNTYTSNNSLSTFTSTNLHGCDSVSTLNLTINTVDVSVTTNDPSITANATGAKYQWLDCNNNYAVIPGDTGQTFTALKNGRYAVEVKENNCTDTSDCITISTVGIVENTLFNDLSIFPNPTTGEITIELKEKIEDFHFKIYDAMGRIVLKDIEVNDQRIYIDLSQNGPGIYHLVMIIEGEEYTTSVIIR